MTNWLPFVCVVIRLVRACHAPPERSSLYCGVTARPAATGPNDRAGGRLFVIVNEKIAALFVGLRPTMYLNWLSCPVASASQVAQDWLLVEEPSPPKYS